MLELNAAGSSPAPSQLAAVPAIGSVAWFRNCLAQLGELLLLVGIVGAALLAMSEVGVRESFSIYLAQSVSAAQKDYVEHSTRAALLQQRYDEESVKEREAKRLLPQSLPELQATATRIYQPYTRAMDASVARQSLARERIAILSGAQQYLNRVSLMGVTAGSPDVPFVSGWLEEQLASLGEEEIARETFGNTGVGGAGSKSRPSIFAQWNTTEKAAVLASPFRGYSLSRMRSELLLAIAVVLAAALGALLAVVRRKDIPTFRTVTLGATTGFIVFLTIKGGRYVFLLQLQGEQASFNPYSATFVALLAGLFSETAYGLLSALVGDLAERLQSAISAPRTGPGLRAPPMMNAALPASPTTPSG